MRLTLVLLAVITSSSASATPGSATAQLTASARTAMVITDSGMWHCDGAACSGLASPALRAAVATCTAVADAAGRVAAFTAAGYSFTDADLVRCNRHVKP